MIRKMLAAAAVALLCAGPALAQEFNPNKPSIGIENGKVDETKFVAAFEKMLACSTPGEYLWYYRDTGWMGPPLCHPNRRIKVISGGTINRGLLERAEKAGLSPEWMRKQLADPKILRLVVKADEYFGVVSRLVDVAIEQDEVQYIFEPKSPGMLYDGLERRRQGFIARRTNEAKAEDQGEIAHLWNELIARQTQRLWLTRANKGNGT